MKKVSTFLQKKDAKSIKDSFNQHITPIIANAIKTIGVSEEVAEMLFKNPKMKNAFKVTMVTEIRKLLKQSGLAV